MSSRKNGFGLTTASTRLFSPQLEKTRGNLINRPIRGAKVSGASGTAAHRDKVLSPFDKLYLGGKISNSRTNNPMYASAIGPTSPH